MKILCDVCREEEAAIFCCADEAALCRTCDERVHLANKLAGKHRRLSLLRPLSTRQFPVCDVCQEKRAFFFCREDRALLCSDCDSSIHGANDLTKKHSRFLFTGIGLSLSSAPVKEEKKLSNQTASFSDASAVSGISEYLIDEPASIIQPTDNFGSLAMMQEEEDPLVWFPGENPVDGSLFSALRVPQTMHLPPFGDAAGEPQRQSQLRRQWVPDDVFAVPELAACETRRRHLGLPSLKRQRTAASSLAADAVNLPLLPNMFFL